MAASPLTLTGAADPHSDSGRLQLLDRRKLGHAKQTNQEEDMGLMDILNGMQNGPRGQPQPPTGSAPESGGMSPIMMALLGLLAY